MNTWTYLCNPNKYDIDNYLKENKNYIYWGNKSHKNKIAINDKIIIWRTQHKKNKNSGVVAIGKIAELPKKRSEVLYPDLLGDKYWLTKDDATSAVVGIIIEDYRLNSKDLMIDNESIKKNKILSNANFHKLQGNTNFYLEKTYYDEITKLWKLKNEKKVINIPKNNHLNIGSIYKRSDLHLLYGGNQQAGGVVSANKNAILIFHTLKTDFNDMYQNEWIGDTFIFFGQGTKGDMQWNKLNKSILEHQKENNKLLFFRNVKGRGGLWRFEGELYCQGYEPAHVNDDKGDLREVIKFHLKKQISNYKSSKSSSVPRIIIDKKNTLKEIEKVKIPTTFVDSVFKQTKKKSKPSTQDSKKTSSRYSKRSKAIGDRAEEIVNRFLIQQKKKHIRWCAREGETPGWDLQYQEKGILIKIEVKGTTAKQMVNFEITENEMNAAKKYGDEYFMYLVADCESTNPKIQYIQNPIKMINNKKISSKPVRWKISVY